MDHIDCKELLKIRHIRVTQKKVAILGEIINSVRPLSASELYERISVKTQLNLATIYRTLNILRERRLVREITDLSGTQYYEISCIHNPVHPHFKCLRCSMISCLPSLNHSETTIVSCHAADCEIHDIAIIMSGICGECRKEET